MREADWYQLSPVMVAVVFIYFVVLAFSRFRVVRRNAVFWL